MMHAAEFVGSMDWPQKAWFWKFLLGLSLSVPVPGMAASASSLTLAASSQTLDSSILIGTDTSTEFGLRVVVDSLGAAYVLSTGGETNSTSTDVFVTKVDSDGQSVIYRTVLGGAGIDIAGGIAVDALGNAYVVGTTGSSDFPIKGGPQFQRFGETDAFVVKLSPQGQIVYSTLLGGKANEQGRGIAVDRTGAVYVTGFTGSTDFIVPNVRDAPIPAGTFQRRLNGTTDGFVVKINPEGTKFLFKTFLGGSAVDSGVAIAVDEVGACYVFGITSSFNFPTRTPAQAELAGGVDAFIAKFNPAGSDLDYSTYLGSKLNDVVDFTTALAAAGDLTLDGNRNVYVASDLDNGSDGFVAKLAADGSAFRFIKRLGGTNSDTVFGLAADASGSIVVVGTTLSPDFPITAGAVQKSLKGEADVFVGWLDPASGALLEATFLGGTASDVGSGIAVAPNGAVFLTGFSSSQDFPITTARPASRRPTFLTKLSRPNLAVPLRFTRFGINGQNGFDLQIQGAPGSNCRLEASTNLRQWSLVTEFTATTEPLTLTRPRQAGEETLFFRAINK